ncbi:MAG: N-acetyl-gamma-glutamyl-phosphate reductase [Clostridia bacterium]|nr:N-acetyl-gamma-glutamyl-phosphate reductase [Clostridia bacterium]
MKKVFVDGNSGTTGLRITERLSERDDIELVTLPDDKRHDVHEREKALNESDVSILCLPDDAAREAVALTKNPDTVIIDASTAHRTAKGWIYGFPELSAEFEEKIKVSKRIAVPGCHAGGFVSLVYPLIKAGYLPHDAHLVCHSLTGYSGGGKKMIAQYEDGERDSLLSAPRQYGTGQIHKHLAEMTSVCELETPPIFCPIVADFYSGMEVTVAIFSDMLRGGVGADEIEALYRKTYTGPVITYEERGGESGFYSAASMTGSDGAKITVEGNGERILLISRFDNLGKGASGAARECLNLVLGVDKTNGLTL